MGIANLPQFQRFLDKIARVEIPAQAALLQKRVAFEAFTRIIQRSPVDTGRFRGNWQTAINSPKTAIVDREDKSGQATLNAGLNNLTNIPPGVVVWITNNLPYAERLEEGHSPQAPDGVVGPVLDELSQLDI